MAWRVLIARFAGMLRRRALDQRLEEELRFHLEMEREKNRQRGMDPSDAEAAARRAFGGTEQIKELYRERRGLPLLETTFKDLRYSFRGLCKSPGFTSIVLISLILGIGANTAIFTLIDTVMLRSLPVRSADKLVTVGDASRPTALLNGGPMANIFSYPLYQRLRDENQVFTGLLASGKAGRTEVQRDGGAIERARARLVSANYFDVLGVTPFAGRVFTAQDERSAGGSPVVVISYDYWAHRFNRNADVWKSTLRINGSPFSVIGIAPPHFAGEVVGSPTDIWIPLPMQPQVNRGDARLENRDSNWLLCMGRLKNGVTMARARAEITALVQNALVDFEGAAASPDRLREIRREEVAIGPGGKGFSWIRKHDSPLLFTLMGLVVLVLFITCANVANLLLARGTKRRKEISMRLALGAGRARIVRQLLAESVLLGGVAGAGGVLLARWGTLLLTQLVSGASGLNPIPFEVDVHPNTNVLAFNAGISLTAAILFGLIPALRVTRLDLAPALKENAQSAGRSTRRLGGVLVVGQIALSTVILVGAGLFLRSLQHLASLDVGYSRGNVVAMAVDLAASGYAPSQRLPVTRKLLEFLRTVPGANGVTVSTNGIFNHLDSSTDSLQAEGFIPLRKEDSWSSFDQIGPHYFRVLGVPLIAGREFDEHDNAGSANAVVLNETMARFYFPESNPIGKRLKNGNDRYTVIGVAKDMKQGNLKTKTERRFFGQLFQTSDPIETLTFEIRTAMPASLVSSIHRATQSFDPNLKISTIEPVSVLIDQDLNGDRLIARLSGFFGIVMLLLAASGLYGVISYTTARRTSEIGLRMAMGANRSDVLRMVLRDTIWLVTAGLAIGLPAAFTLTHLIRAMLTGIQPNDPAVFTGSSLLMMTTGIFAGFIPAARASRIEPVAALRQQ